MAITAQDRALGQAGVGMLLSGLLERWCRRRRVWLAVVALNAVVMTVYLWHMVPDVVVALAAFRLGLLDDVVPLPGAWFAARVPWVLACAVVRTGSRPA
ncbi:MAG: hypothetical protein ACKVZ6_05715 [Kineosporiaceae bacterium]